MYPEQNLYQLIIRLFAGEASNEEKSSIESWLNQESGNRKLLDDLKEIWLSSGIKNNPDHYDVERAIQKFTQKTSFQKRKAIPENHRLQLVRYAAILL